MASTSRGNAGREQPIRTTSRAVIRMPLGEGEQLKRPYMIPTLRLTPGRTPKATTSKAPPPVTDITFPGFDIFSFEKHLPNPVLLYGQPYAGKTNLFLKLCVFASAEYGKDHFVLLLELRLLANICGTLRKRAKTFLELLALQMNTDEKSLKNIFKPRKGKVKDKKKRYTGELFLDSWDEVPEKERNYFAKLLVDLLAECPVRIWMTCRNYLKPSLSKIFPGVGHLDMLPYSAQQQSDFLYSLWKIETPPELVNGKEERLRMFSSYLHAQLCVILPDFATTIGCTPIFIEGTSGVYEEHMKLFLQMDTKDPHQVLFIRRGARFTELINKLIGKIMEAYCLKMTSITKFSIEYMKRECTQILQLNSEYALKTYPEYEFGDPEHPQPSHSKATEKTNKHAYKVPEDLQRIGFVVTGDNGHVRFHHKSFGDYFLANYFEYKHSMKEMSLEFDRFYLRVMLFEKDATEILTFYDNCLGKYDSELLHDFLIQHYRLEDGKEREWQMIRNCGNVWHLAIMQGFHQLARYILSAFKPNEKSEMAKFFRMKVPMRSGEKYAAVTSEGMFGFSKQILISSLSVLALFGYDDVVEETFQAFLRIYEPEELQSEFNNHGMWTPLHFAAAHVNFCFLSQLYGEEFQKVVKIQPGVFNGRGYTPLHLLMTRCWSHEILVGDVNLSDYDDMPSSSRGPAPETPGPSTSQVNKPGCIGQGRVRGKARKKERITKSADKPEEAGKIPIRLLIRGRDYEKDFYGVPGLLGTLHQCMQILVEVGGEDVNGFDSGNGATLMHRAAQEGFLETTLFLLCLGADANIQNVTGVTPLHLAALNGNKECFLALIKNGAKVIFMDDQGYSAITMWREWGEVKYFEKGGKPLSKLEIAIFQCALEVDDLLGDIKASEAMEARLKLFEQELNEATRKQAAAEKQKSGKKSAKGQAVAGPSKEPVEGPSKEPVAGPSQEPFAGPSKEPVAGPSKGSKAKGKDGKGKKSKAAKKKTVRCGEYHFVVEEVEESVEEEKVEEIPFRRVDPKKRNKRQNK